MLKSTLKHHDMHHCLLPFSFNTTMNRICFNLSFTISQTTSLGNDDYLISRAYMRSLMLILYYQNIFTIFLKLQHYRDETSRIEIGLRIIKNDFKAYEPFSQVYRFKDAEAV